MPLELDGQRQTRHQKETSAVLLTRFERFVLSSSSLRIRLRSRCFFSPKVISSGGSLFSASLVPPTSKPFGPVLVKPGTRPGGALGPGRPGGVRPNAQCSVDCGQIGIARSPRAPDHILSSSPTRLFRLPNLEGANTRPTRPANQARPRGPGLGCTACGEH
jgi:hypothetical protein